MSEFRTPEGCKGVRMAKRNLPFTVLSAQEMCRAIDEDGRLGLAVKARLVAFEVDYACQVGADACRHVRLGRRASAAVMTGGSALESSRHRIPAGDVAPRRRRGG